MKRYISRKSVNGKPCALRGASTVWRGDCTNQYSETIQGGVFLPYHWTGHESRLNRDFSGNCFFYVEPYAFEELVAEISSMFVSAETGIDQTKEHFDNHAAYVSSWLKAIDKDPNALFNAVKLANQAANEILKHEREANVNLMELSNKKRADLLSNN